MENLIVLILSYVIIIGLLYAPKCPQINAQVSVKKYHTKTIRELKKIASQSKVKGYGSMNKAQLIQILEVI